MSWEESNRKHLDWLANLKVGDPVAIMSGYHGGSTKVTDETKLYWIVGSCKYRKSDGRVPGQGSVWGGRDYLQDPESESVKGAQREHERRVRLNQLRQVKWSELTADQQAEIHQRIMEMIEQNKIKAAIEADISTAGVIPG